MTGAAHLATFAATALDWIGKWSAEALIGPATTIAGEIIELLPL
ncbi:hypothetical protein [Nocardiopsis sp. CNT-189]